MISTCAPSLVSAERVKILEERALNVSMNLVHLLYDLALPDGALSDPSSGRWLHVEIVVTTGEAPEHSSKQFACERGLLLQEVWQSPPVTTGFMPGATGFMLKAPQRPGDTLVS